MLKIRYAVSRPDRRLSEWVSMVRRWTTFWGERGRKENIVGEKTRDNKYLNNR